MYSTIECQSNNFLFRLMKTRISRFLVRRLRRPAVSHPQTENILSTYACDEVEAGWSFFIVCLLTTAFSSWSKIERWNRDRCVYDKKIYLKLRNCAATASKRAKFVLLDFQLALATEYSKWCNTLQSSLLCRLQTSMKVCTFAVILNIKKLKNSNTYHDVWQKNIFIDSFRAVLHQMH